MAKGGKEGGDGLSWYIIKTVFLFSLSLREGRREERSEGEKWKENK